MKKFDDNLIPVDCITHKFSDLPKKGLGRSMDGVGINEPVIIHDYDTDEVEWGYTKAEIERREYELQATTNWMELPSDNLGRKIKMWFSKTKYGSITKESCRGNHQG